MRLAMRLPSNKSGTQSDLAGDPREEESAEIIDLASRTAYPVVTQRKRGSDGLGLAAGVAIVCGLGAITLWSMNAARVSPPEGVGNPAVQPPATEPAPAPAQANEVAPANQNQQPVPAPAPVYAAAPSVPAAAVTNPYSSPTMIVDMSYGQSLAPLSGAVAAPGAAGEDASNVGTNSASAFASRIGGVGGTRAQATAMVNPATTVTQGTLIPAVLETAINTDVPGFVRAVVSQDVRSFDGTSVLVPRGSRLIGQYQSGLQGGQKRAYVIWTRLIRPDGASVEIASPAVAFDGTTGLEGKVNSHFFKRFGSAMLLSVVGGLGSIASGGSSVILGGAGQSAASVAAQQDSQIGPTIRVRQGEPIRVFTARDLDFSAVN